MTTKKDTETLSGNHNPPVNFPDSHKLNSRLRQSDVLVKAADSEFRKFVSRFSPAEFLLRFPQREVYLNFVAGLTRDKFDFHGQTPIGGEEVNKAQTSVQYGRTAI